MENRFISIDRTNFTSQKRIKDVSILIPKIRAEFYVRLYSLLKSEPEISDEGYEFFIKDTDTGKKFSAGLTGFGPGYFSDEESDEIIKLVDDFHESVMRRTEMLECRMEYTHDFGRSILGYKNGEYLEIDIAE